MKNLRFLNRPLALIGLSAVLAGSVAATFAADKKLVVGFSQVGAESGWRTANTNAKEIHLLFAHNDDMALGAIQAMEEAGIKPGVNIKIVSIDGVKGAFEAMKDGKLNVTVECNPLLGPQLFDLIEAAAAKKEVPKRVVTQEGVYEQSQAAAELPKRQY